MLDPYRVAHFSAGFLSALSVLVSPVFPIVGFLIFFSYELNQELHKDDWFDEEMLEYGCGFFVAVALMLISSIF